MASPETPPRRLSPILARLCVVGGILAAPILLAAPALACGNSMTVRQGIFWPLVGAWAAAAICSLVVLCIVRIIERFKSQILTKTSKRRVVMAIFALATAITAIGYAASVDVEDWRFFDETKSRWQPADPNTKVTF